jgi:hypothetical protein
MRVRYTLQARSELDAMHDGCSSKNWDFGTSRWQIFDTSQPTASARLGK